MIDNRCQGPEDRVLTSEILPSSTIFNTRTCVRAFAHPTGLPSLRYRPPHRLWIAEVSQWSCRPAAPNYRASNVAAAARKTVRVLMEERGAPIMHRYQIAHYRYSYLSTSAPITNVYILQASTYSHIRDVLHCTRTAGRTN